MSDEKMREEFNKLAKEFGYDLTRGYSQEYSYQTTQNVWKLWQASAAHSAARIAELEGQVADCESDVDELADHNIELQEQVAMLRDCLQNVGSSKWWADQANAAISATAQTAEQYKRRVQAEALEEAADELVSRSGETGMPGLVSAALVLRRMASELRNPAMQAEGKGEK